MAHHAGAGFRDTTSPLRHCRRCEENARSKKADLHDLVLRKARSGDEALALLLRNDAALALIDTQCRA
jgi:hypothetical protein